MYRIRYITVAVSLFLHISVIGIAGAGGMFRNMMHPVPLPQKGHEVSLEFVDTPDKIKETAVKKKINTISDKTAVSRDMENKKAKENAAAVKEASEMKQMPKRTVHPVPRHNVPPVPAEVPAKQQQEEKKQENRMEYDIINLPDVSDSIYSAPEKGELAFEAQAHKIGPYFKKVKEKIERYWMGYITFRYRNTSPAESTAVVSFKILPGGDVKDVKVLEYTGDELFRDFCVSAVVSTGPFPPLPGGLRDEFKKKGLSIVFTFKYK